MQDRGIEPEIIDYQKSPPDIDEIRRILQLLSLAPGELVRRGEAIYKDLHLASASDEELLKAMAANPILIQRPIVLANGKASLGRPPESVLEIL